MTWLRLRLTLRKSGVDRLAQIIKFSLCLLGSSARVVINPAQHLQRFCGPSQATPSLGFVQFGQQRGQRLHLTVPFAIRFGAIKQGEDFVAHCFVMS